MFRLSKKIEYAILAVQYIANNSGLLTTAKEIADKQNIPYEFLSKSLQKLMKHGLLESQQGPKGGYLLSKPANEITIEEIILALDETPGIVECMTSKVDDPCDRTSYCTIKQPMIDIQKQINFIFKKTTIAHLSNVSANILE